MLLLSVAKLQAMPSSSFSEGTSNGETLLERDLLRNPKLICDVSTGWKYSGPPDAEQVFRAICHGYPVDRLPDPCVNVIRFRSSCSGVVKAHTLTPRCLSAWPSAVASNKFFEFCLPIPCWFHARFLPLHALSRCISWMPSQNSSRRWSA